MKQLFKLSKNYRKQFILGPFFKFLEAIFELLLPLFMAKLIDNGILKNDWQTVMRMTYWMIGISILGLLCAVICQYYASIASQGFGTDLRNQLMQKINELSYSQLNSFGTDTLITRLTSDINQVQLAVAMLIRLFVRAPFLSIGSIIMAFVINWKIGLIFLIILPIFSILLFFISKKSVPLYKKVQSQLDVLNERVSQNLAGIRVIRAFSRTPSQEQQFNKTTEELAKTNITVANLSAWLSPMTILLMNLAIVFIFYIGGIQVNIGGLQQGQLLALINYMNQMLLALIVVANLVVLFTRAKSSAERIEEVLEKPTNRLLPINPSATSKQRFNLNFENVSFKYGEKFGNVLQNISFEAPAKTTIGIIGPTGSGKTTLLQLIPKFYSATEGKITLNGTNIENFPAQKIRNQIAIVPQTAVLFSGTLRENLQWGKPDATDEECWQALEIAQIANFVKLLPQQLDEPIFEGGKNFSGGQRQRLTIARAVIAKPSILLLDDSLSALDFKTDLDLRRALETKIAATIIIVSQRVRSIQEADKILVLDQGYLTASGSHEELLKYSPEYQEIVATQEEENES